MKKRTTGILAGATAAVVTVGMASSCITTAFAASAEQRAEKAAAHIALDSASAALSLAFPEFAPLTVMGFSFVTSWVDSLFGGEQEDPRLDEILDKLSGIDRQLDDEHSETEQLLDQIQGSIDAMSFTEHMRTVQSDADGMSYVMKKWGSCVSPLYTSDELELMKANKLTDAQRAELNSRVIDDDTYYAYCQILGSEAYQSAVYKNFTEMSKYINGTKISSEGKGYVSYLTALRDKFVSRADYSSFDAAPDFAPVAEVYRDELDQMQAILSMDCVLLYTTASIESQCCRYRQAHNLPITDDAGKAVTCEQRLAQINDRIYGANGIAWAMQTVSSEYKAADSALNEMTSARVTDSTSFRNQVTKSFPYLTDAWKCACGLVNAEKCATVTLNRDLTATEQSGFADYTRGMSPTAYGFTSQGAFQVPAKGTLTVDGDGHTVTADVTLLNNASVFDCSDKGWLTLNNLRLEAGGNHPAAYAVTSANGLDRLNLTGCTFNGFTDSAINNLPHISSKASISGCTFTNNGYGYRAVNKGTAYQGTSPSLSISFSKCTFQGNSKAGVYIDEPIYSSISVNSCTFDSNSGTALHLVSFSLANNTIRQRCNSIMKCHFYNNKGSEDGIAIYSNDTNIYGCDFTGDRTSGKGADEIALRCGKIEGCTFNKCRENVVTISTATKEWVVPVTLKGNTYTMPYTEIPTPSREVRVSGIYEDKGGNIITSEKAPWDNKPSILPDITWTGDDNASETVIIVDDPAFSSFNSTASNETSPIASLMEKMLKIVC